LNKKVIKRNVKGMKMTEDRGTEFCNKRGTVVVLVTNNECWMVGVSAGKGKSTKVINGHHNIFNEISEMM
jgi:hypothetical protein